MPGSFGSLFTALIGSIAAVVSNELDQSEDQSLFGFDVALEVVVVVVLAAAGLSNCSNGSIGSSSRSFHSLSSKSAHPPPPPPPPAPDDEFPVGNDENDDDLSSSRCCCCCGLKDAADGFGLDAVSLIILYNLGYFMNV